MLRTTVQTVSRWHARGQELTRQEKSLLVTDGDLLLRLTTM